MLLNIIISLSNESQYIKDEFDTTREIMSRIADPQIKLISLDFEALMIAPFI